MGGGKGRQLGDLAEAPSSPGLWRCLFPGGGSCRRPIRAGLGLIAADACIGTANTLHTIPPNGDSNLDRYEPK
jgi:hypothetical protein